MGDAPPCARGATRDRRRVRGAAPGSGLFVLDDAGTLWTPIDAKPKSTRALRRVKNLAENPRASLLVDHYEEDWRELRWIAVHGHGELVTGAAAAPALRALREKYPQYAEVEVGPEAIRLVPDRIVAWSCGGRELAHAGARRQLTADQPPGMNSVARPRNAPMLTTSVAVVRKMLDAVAGSAPSFFNTSGMVEPEMPLAAQLKIIASEHAETEDEGVFAVLHAREDVHPDPRHEADEDAVEDSDPGLLDHRLRLQPVDLARARGRAA